MFILKDRNLNKAILVSVIGHFVFILAINPVMPGFHQQDARAGVFFLGSILEKVVPVAEKSYEAEQRHVAPGIDRHRHTGGKNLMLTPPETNPRSVTGLSDKGQEFAADTKKGLSFSSIFSKKPLMMIRFSDDEIKGDAANRLLLYKPDLPKISSVISDFSSSHKVVMKVNISRHGFVEAAEFIVSSGSPEIDQAVFRYVRRWQFVPLPEDSQDSQSGIIRINL